MIWIGFFSYFHCEIGYSKTRTYKSVDGVILSHVEMDRKTFFFFGCFFFIDLIYLWQTSKRFRQVNGSFVLEPISVRMSDLNDETVASMCHQKWLLSQIHHVFMSSVSIIRLHSTTIIRTHKHKRISLLASYIY